jgi:hypothetical protein
MVRIPTPVPAYVRDWVGGFLSNSLPIILYRTTLLVVGSLLLYAALASPYVLAGLVASTIFGIVYANDIRATISDIWNLNYWVVRT